MKYRIIERQGHFAIEVEATKLQGVFLTTEVKYWSPATPWGTPVYIGTITPPRCKEFSTVKKAREKIKIWNSPVIIHEP